MSSFDSTSMPSRRCDLIQLADRYSPRRWTLVDAMSGRIVRVSTTDLQAIESPASDSGEPMHQTLTAQAAASGLLRHRAKNPTRLSVSPLNLLAFRVPLFNIDPVAKWLAPHTGILFSPVALLSWGTLIIIALTSLLIDWARAEQTLLAVYKASASATMIGYTIGGFFIITKALHELGHAVACRRMGAQVGDFGLFFFLGIPCPYVDVSRVWQLDSKIARASVMLAGIYTELVIAAVATFAWWLTPPGPVHLLAMNLILVCGMSTVLFNANPLMRMDGYFVVSDILGSPNLRRQASLAWHSLAINRLSGMSPAARVDFASVSLSMYHIASSLYRLAIVILIAGFCFALLREWQLWWMGIAMLISITLALVYRYAKKWMTMIQGEGTWRNTSLARRISFALLGLVVAAIIPFIPVKREIASTGFVDVMDAIDIHVPEPGWVSEVMREFGEPVQAGETLAKLRNEELAVQLVGLKTRQRISALESSYLKRQSLQSRETDVAWQVDKANRELVESQLQSIISREQRLALQSPKSGIIVPPLPVSGGTHTAASFDDTRSSRLERRKDTYVASKSVWCRVGSPDKLCVNLPISREERQYLRAGHKVKLVVDDGSIRQWDAAIQSIEEMATGEPPVNAASFMVRCALPSGGEPNSLASIIGMRVDAKIQFDQEPAWRWAKRTFNEWLGNCPS